MHLQSLYRKITTMIIDQQAKDILFCNRLQCHVFFVVGIAGMNKSVENNMLQFATSPYFEV